MREVIGKSVAGVADFLSLGFDHIILKKESYYFCKLGFSDAIFSLGNFVMGFSISALSVVLGVSAVFPIPGGRV